MPLRAHDTRLVVDADRDGVEEVFTLTWDEASGEGGIRITTPGDTGEILRSEFRRKNYRPFLIRSGDIDNDGEIEIAVGLFDRWRVNRPQNVMKIHLFDYHDGRLAPLWFSERKFDDFRIASLSGKNRLVELRKEGGSAVVRVFTWNHFGFWRTGRPLVSRQDVALDASGDTLTLCDRKSGKAARLEMENDEIVVRHE